MKTAYITEDRNLYLIRIATFAFVMVMTIGVWYYIKIRGSEVFVAIGVLGFLYSVYCYICPRQLIRMNARGTKVMATQVTVPWEYIETVTEIPYEEGNYVRPGMRYIVCRGYSPRMQETVEWWRVPVTAKQAAATIERVLHYRDTILAKEQEK